MSDRQRGGAGATGAADGGPERSAERGPTGAADRGPAGEAGPSGPCPECGGAVAAEAGTETVCTDCGLVVATDRVDRGPEWRSRDDEDRDHGRGVGAPVTELRHDRGLSTTVGNGNRDARGQPLSARRRRRVARLRELDDRYRVRDARDRNLRHALGEIERMGCALGLPDRVRETAAATYRAALSADVVVGRSVEGVATACLYAAARRAGVPRSTGDVAATSRVEERRFLRDYRTLVRELDLDVPPADPATFLRRYASSLGVATGTERRARRLLRDARETGAFAGKSPTGLAAAALYAAAVRAGEDVTQADVCSVADVCEMTVRNRYPELIDAAGEW